MMHLLYGYTRDGETINVFPAIAQCVKNLIVRRRKIEARVIFAHSESSQNTRERSLLHGGHDKSLKEMN